MTNVIPFPQTTFNLSDIPSILFKEFCGFPPTGHHFYFPQPDFSIRRNMTKHRNKKWVLILEHNQKYGNQWENSCSLHVYRSGKKINMYNENLPRPFFHIRTQFVPISKDDHVPDSRRSPRSRYEYEKVIMSFSSQTHSYLANRLNSVHWKHLLESVRTDFPAYPHLKLNIPQEERDDFCEIISRVRTFIKKGKRRKCLKKEISNSILISQGGQ